MFGTSNSACRRWWLAGLTLFTFLFLLGGRSLNEPDEGRYATIAQEMLQRGDWLVPHLWYVPHLDKPPMTYWLVAASMSLFGQNEWAVRLPLALAGMAGVLLAYLFARRLAGERAGLWAALILQSSMLYFVMARMLTTDVFLTQFIGGAVYCFWRSWESLDGTSRPALATGPAPAPHSSPPMGERVPEGRLVGGAGATVKSWKLPLIGAFFPWHVAGWALMGLGFLTKGPIALAVPLVSLLALGVYRRHDKARLKALVCGALMGVPVFAVVALPWFLLLFQRVPQSFDFMVFGQAVGHALGTTIKNRQGHPLYFFAILAVGFLPWTILLGWLWRRAHWRGLSPLQREAWVLLSAWVIFTFTVFTLTSAKLPAYILPIFPALAVMVAMRWFEDGKQQAPSECGTRNAECGMGSAPPSGWAWRVCLGSAPLLMAAIPVVIHFAFRLSEPAWLKAQFAAGVVALTALVWISRKWPSIRCATGAVLLALVNLYLFCLNAPSIETSLRSNQTLKPLAEALKREYRQGDKVVCWGRLPQGLPFYAHPVIAESRRPLMGGMPLGQVPFAFPGNRERFGDLLLEDEGMLASLLSLKQRVFVVGFQGTFARLQAAMPGKRLRMVARVGQWELLANH